jgi:predicted DNA-binding protein
MIFGIAEVDLNTQMLIRIDGATKEKLGRLARRQGKNYSQMVREILDDYIRERDIEGYVDDLWQRIGRTLKDKKAKVGGVATAIKAVRRQEHESRH